MAKKVTPLWKRWVGEFVVIVASVLVALGVDDMRQGASDRRLEAYILTRVASDIDADLAELDRASLRARRRLWIASALLADFGETDVARGASYPQGSVDPSDPCTPTCDPHSSSFRPLSTLARFTQFDVTDPTYQEAISTGSLRVLRDLGLREALASYYDGAHEAAGGDERCGRYHEQFVNELATTGLTQQSQLNLAELTRHLRQFPFMRVSLRRLVIAVSCQLGNYQRVQATATALRSSLD